MNLYSGIVISTSGMCHGLAHCHGTSSSIKWHCSTSAKWTPTLQHEDSIGLLFPLFTSWQVLDATASMLWWMTMAHTQSFLCLLLWEEDNTMKPKKHHGTKCNNVSNHAQWCQGCKTPPPTAHTILWHKVQCPGTKCNALAYCHGMMCNTQCHNFFLVLIFSSLFFMTKNTPLYFSVLWGPTKLLYDNLTPPLICCTILLVNGWPMAIGTDIPPCPVSCYTVLCPCALPYLVYGVCISYINYAIPFTAVALPCTWYTFLQFPVHSTRPTVLPYYRHTIKGTNLQHSLQGAYGCTPLTCCILSSSAGLHTSAGHLLTCHIFDWPTSAR